MLYLLDASVLITASSTYYQLDQVPEFWEWLVHVAEEGNAKVVEEVYEEFKDGDDLLGEWARRADVKAAIVLRESVDVNLARRVTRTGYAEDLTDDELVKLGRYPFLIAYGLVDIRNRTIVTAEVSRPGKQRGNRRIPNVCETLGVRWCDTFGFTTALSFSTRWKRR